ncbi:unnamed protein product, partial [Polarella glacialis]
VAASDGRHGPSDGGNITELLVSMSGEALSENACKAGSSESCHCPAPTSCFLDDRCPALGCGALGIAKCRFCGFAAYALVACPKKDLPTLPATPTAPPGNSDSCDPVGVYECGDESKTCFGIPVLHEINKITQVPGSPYFWNAVNMEEAKGWELDWCERVPGRNDVVTCVTAEKVEALGGHAKYLEMLTFDATCARFTKKVWRMYPLPANECSYECRRSMLLL